jgi:glc operon protein GlcG
MRVFSKVGAAASALAVAMTASAMTAQVLEKKVVSFAAARKMAAAAQEAAKAKGVAVVVVVVDDGGHIVLLERMDGAQVASVNVGIGKARTAAIYRRPSKVFEDQIKNGRVAALALADATPLQGGVPVLYEGKVIGAIGVSGDSPQIDEDIAMAGAAAFR